MIEEPRIDWRPQRRDVDLVQRLRIDKDVRRIFSVPAVISDVVLGLSHYALALNSR